MWEFTAASLKWKSQTSPRVAGMMKVAESIYYFYECFVYMKHIVLCTIVMRHVLSSNFIAALHALFIFPFPRSALFTTTREHSSRYRPQIIVCIEQRTYSCASQESNGGSKLSQTSTHLLADHIMRSTPRAYKTINFHYCPFSKQLALAVIDVFGTNRKNKIQTLKRCAPRWSEHDHIMKNTP